MKVLAIFALIALCGSCANALYEDQIKKFDWRKQNIGALKDAHLELNSFQARLVLSTQEDVIATLCPKTGELLWRQVLESGARGALKLLQVGADSNDGSNTAAARPNSNHAHDILTVQGHAPAIVRAWNANNGLLEWEWSLVPLQTERAQYAFWFYSNAMLHHVLPFWQSHLEVTQYFPATGNPTGTTSKISADWITANNCMLSGTFYSCLNGNQLISLDLSANQPQVLKTSLNAAPKEKLKPLKGMNGVFNVDGQLVNVNDQSNAAVCTNLQADDYVLGSYNQKRIIVQATLVNGQLQIAAHYVSNCQPIEEIVYSIAYPENYGKPTLKTFDCKLKRQNNDGKHCMFIFGTEDEAILAVQQGKLRWTRDEALASVIATEFIDLPLADSEGTLENEMKGKHDDIFGAFVQRISTQAIQIKSIFLHVIGLAPPPTDRQRAGLVRDSFGLHKMLVVLTRCGKIFGIDNLNGKQHWQLYLPQMQNFNNEEAMRLLVQRTAKHFPLLPLCAIVAKNKFTGNGIIFRFNPVTGKAIEGGLLQLNYAIKQLSLLAENEDDFVKGILLIDGQNNVEVYPENAKKKADRLFLFTADKSTGVLDGFHVSFKNNQLKTRALWTVRLGGHNNEQRIIAVAAKNPIEHVHSQGRVLGDRSVLYKYINPNLVAVFTEANDTIHKYVLNVYLVDVVSGSVIFSMKHRKVRAPLHVVHSENWLAYTYYNDKVRRTEITTIELYEGKTQTNNSVWSSLHAPPMPLIERQSYIIPAVVQALRETITERGITNKDLLIGTANGAIIELPWTLLDPRRPVSSTTQGREEGAIPYMPELPLPTENIVNYNQTIVRLRNIFTAPSGLESTCLLMATGLDIFVTRIAPSKTFDLLKEDFDYILITLVLVALTTGSFVVKQLASRKILKQAWK